MTSYLLLNCLQRDDELLNNSEQEILQKTSQGDVDSVLNLIESGVDVNVQDENGMTALMIASDAGYLTLIKELISGNEQTLTPKT